MTGPGEYRLYAVLRADDVERAARFYTEVLGLRREAKAGLTDEIVLAGANGSGVMIYRRPGMPAPQNTTLGFAVPNEAFDDVVKTLRERGVTFEEYDIPEIGLRTESGVAMFDGGRAAWFKDTEGNILNIATI